MYKPNINSRESGDSYIGFDRDFNRRQSQLTKNINQKSKFLLRILLMDVFGFVQHQLKATYSLGDKLTITKNIDNSVLNKDKATTIGKI